MSVIGVDFGNDTCVIGIAARGGIDIILNENSNRKNPCLVSFQGKQRLMGEAALSVARSNFKNTVREFKRLVGRKWGQVEVAADCARVPYKTMEHPETGGVGIRMTYDGGEKVFAPEQIVAMMLTKLAAIAKSSNSDIDVADVVLAIPGWYTDAMRRAMVDACKVGGINCLRLMHEHTATALAYGIYKSAKGLFHSTEPEHVLFLDLGHSTFSASVVKFVQGSLTVKSASFDRSLGGRDMDWAIVLKMAAEFKAKTGKDPMTEPKAVLKLMDAAEKAKKNLSPLGVKDTNINVEFLVDETDYSGRLTREEFEGLIKPLVERMEAPVVQALREAGVAKEKLSAVEIVGGATRVPMVKAFLSDLLGRDKNVINFGLSCTLNADESVARGCALQCAMLSSRFKVKEFAIVEAVPYPIRLSWEDDNVAPAPMDGADEEGEEGLAGEGGSVCVFQRNDETPKVRRVNLTKSTPFTITASYDKGADLPEGTDTTIGSFKVDLPKGEEGVKVRVNVKHDIHGIFTVSTAEMMKEVKQQEEATPKGQDVGGVAPMEVDAEMKEKEPKVEGQAGNGSASGERVDGEGDGKSSTKEGGPESADMDTASPPKGSTLEPLQKKKKPVFSKVALSVNQSTSSWSKEKIDAAVLEEAQMANQDRILRETAEKRNELETYIYAMRDRLVEQLQPYIEAKLADSFKERLTEAEDWLYSDEGFDSTKSIYSSKLEELTSIGSPVEARLYEATHREDTVKELRGAVELYTKFVNSTDDAYAHLEDEERSKMRSACEEMDRWLFEKLEKQSALSACKDPVVTCAEIKGKSKSLHSVCRPIMTKPKPKPAPPQDEAKQSATPSGEGKKQAGAEPEAMGGESNKNASGASSTEGEKVSGDGVPADADGKGSRREKGVAEGAAAPAADPGAPSPMETEEVEELE